MTRFITTADLKKPNRSFPIRLDAKLLNTVFLHALQPQVTQVAWKPLRLTFIHKFFKNASRSASVVLCGSR